MASNPRNRTAMGFSVKCILGDYVNAEGLQRVYLQATIDSKPARVPMDFYLSPEDFSVKRQVIKSTHPNARTFEAEMLQAKSKANDIASRYRLQGKQITPDDFRREFADPTIKSDVIKYIREALELKKDLATNTRKSHQTLINKLTDFRKSINFSHISIELIQKFRNHLIAAGNGTATVEKHLKILKQYLGEASKAGISVPSFELKIKKFRSNRNALSELELMKLDKYFNRTDTPQNHKRVLRYFLFSCYTGLRISDIHNLQWLNVDDEYVTYLPEKTKKDNEIIKVPLIPINKQYLPEYTFDADRVFDTYSDPATNRILKSIAAECGIKKKITYHTSRHTFGSLIAEEDVVAAQKLMGHALITTTMEYVHVNPTQLVEAMAKRFGKSTDQIVAESTVGSWRARLFGQGICIVSHNHSAEGNGLYILIEPVRPFLSKDIEKEIAAGKWAKLDWEQREGMPAGWAQLLANWENSLQAKS